MDTYIRTIIVLLVNLILEVHGQGGGVAIPWGQGVGISMADFDPFANERAKHAPEVIVMDPHDPNRPKFAADTPVVGGGAAVSELGVAPGSSGEWTKERSFSSFSASSSSSKETSSTKEFSTRPRDSGGVAISLPGFTASIPGNEHVNVNENHIRFVDKPSWFGNARFNASALNVSVSADVTNVVNASVYSDVDNAFNMSMFPDFDNASYSDNAFFHNNSSEFMNYYTNYSNYSNYSNSNYSDASDILEPYIGIGGLPGSTSDIVPDRISNNSFSVANETTNTFNYSDTASSSSNTTGDVTLINSTGISNLGAHLGASVSETRNIMFLPEPLQNMTATPLNKTDLTSKHKSAYNGLNKVSNITIPSFKAPGITGPAIVSSFYLPSNVEETIKNTAESNQIGNEIKSSFYDKVNEKLEALNKMYNLSENKAGENFNDTTVFENHLIANNAEASFGASTVAPGDVWYQTNSTRFSNVAIPEFQPAGKPKEVPYKRPEPMPTPTRKPSLDMGIPISFGFNLPGLSVEKSPISPAASDSGSDTAKTTQDAQPQVVSGLEGGTFVTLGIDASKELGTATAKQDSVSLDRGLVGNVPEPPVQKPPTIQQPVVRRQEPDLPMSRQPIIETQPAVDFMSTFLSQPIDPTRRGNRQKPVDTQTDISIVPLENQQSVAPSQTLVQDGKSRDWRSFISSFLMGGGPGFDQTGPAAFGQMPSNPATSHMGGATQGSSFANQMSGSSQSQVEVSSSSQIDGRFQGQQDVAGMGPIEVPSFAPSSTGNQISGLSTGQGLLASTKQQSKQVDHIVGQLHGQSVTSQQMVDTSMDQSQQPGTRQTESQPAADSFDMFGITPLGEPGRLSLGQLQEQRVITADQSSAQGVETGSTIIGEPMQPNIDLNSSGASISDRATPVNPVKEIRESIKSGGGVQGGVNTAYEIVENNQTPMQNIIGLSDTSPFDPPQPAESTSIPTQVTPIGDSQQPVASPQVDLGLSEKPLTSFEGASPSDLQKLKLLEVAQRLLLQERGIKDPQSGSQVQTFTPTGMPGSIENLLSSLNQVNSMAEMIKSSLNQGASQTTQDSAKPVDPQPKRNVKLGEWSSGTSFGADNRNSVPVGNIFAGRFLQSGTGLPIVGGTPKSPSGGIPVGFGQSAESRGVTSETSPFTSTSRGGGLVIKDKLPLPYEQRPCINVIDPTSKYHFYRKVSAGRVRFRCALGTAFDQDTCDCTIRVISNGNCLEVDMNFNKGRVEDVSPNQLPIGNYNVEVSNRTAVYPGIAVFDGQSKLIIWRYQNYDFRDHVMLKFRFRPGVGGDRYQPIIANCDGNPDGPAIAIVFDKQTNEVIMILRTDSNNDKNLRFRVNPNQWSEVTYLYDGNSFIGLVNNNRQSMPTQGLVQISDEALILGYCSRYGHYTGAVDDVKIYTCIPRENRFLLS